MVDVFFGPKTKKVSIHLSIYACHPYSRGQANLLFIVPIFTDDDFRHSVNRWEMKI